MSTPHATPPSLRPEAVLMQLLFSKMAFFSLSAVARLGIADHLTDSPRHVDDVARDSATHSPSLYRVLRLLVSVGVFSEGPDRHFALNPTGELLRSAHPHSLRDMAIMFTDPWQLASYQKIEECIRTGTDGTTLNFGKHAFDLFHDIPDQAANFHRAMSSFSGVAAAAVLEVADFARFQKLADCGGGHGILLGRILDRFTSLKGVVFDLPEVVSGAPDAGFCRNAEGRVEFESGSFFERVPGGCDAYIMKHIVHDWDDGSCRRILSLMRDQLMKTAPSGGRVFLCELVVPEGPAPAPSKMLDIEMLVCTSGGKERTEAEFVALFQSAGLKLVSIKTTHSPVCLIEAAVAE